MKLSDEAQKKAEQNQSVLSLLSLQFSCSESTIRRWIKNNDVILTTPDAVKIISKEIKIAPAKLLVA